MPMSLGASLRAATLPGNISLHAVDLSPPNVESIAVKIVQSLENEHNLVSPYTPLALTLVLAVALTGAAASARVGERFAGVCAVVGFMCCSSMMLVVNKVALASWDFPMTLIALQLLSCGLGVRLFGCLGVIEVEPLNFSKILGFGVTPLAFLATLFSNMKILEFANVETFIMMRTCAPLATTVLDYMFLGRELPSCRSVLALLLSCVGAFAYVQADSYLKLAAYYWGAIWLSLFLFDQVYIKHIISTVPMSSWSRVFYQNFLAAVPMCFISAYGEDSPRNLNYGYVGSKWCGIALVLISCGMGTAMSFFSFKARDALSATGFTVTGNVCKVLSVFVNVFIWDKHASNRGLLALSLCIIGGALYQQSPLRKEFVMPAKTVA